MSDLDSLEPRWPRYGLRGDPFFSNPLDPDAETVRPIRLFRGRGSERRRLVQAALDGDHSATLLHAAGGHGKTTLANAAAYDLSMKGVIMLPEEIQFSPESGALGFLRELFHGILQALSDHGVPIPEVPDDPAELEHHRHRGLAEARRLVQIIRVRSGFGGGGGAFGVSAQGAIQYDFLRPAYEPTASKGLLQRVLEDIRDLRPEFRDVVIRVNNLDVAATTDAEALRRFLLEIRDLLQVDGCHYFLMGNDVVRDLIEDEPRVQGVFETPLKLGPFSERDVLGILKARYDFLALPGAEPRSPVHDDLVTALHDVHYGDLRNILRDLRRSVQTVDPVEARPITAEQTLPLLEDTHYQHLKRRLRREAWETLGALEASPAPLRQKDLAETLSVSEPAMSARFRTLTENKVVELVRVEGRSQYYRVPGHVRMALNAARRAGDLPSP
jgi:DNA-binding transcriptional ArsR family regulator